ncbi:hypothetical protein BGW39_009492 [Mortierella sp. 14UC]|nr:hypothetical protein BGW39_009492 [Mortierella sp. 14UC]
MPRRKHALEDPYSSDDDQPFDRGVSQRDLEDEAEQFRDPMHSGRRKRNKNKDIYGSFYDSGSDDEGTGSRSRGSSSRGRKREGFEFVAATSSSNKSQPDTSSASQAHKVRFAESGRANDDEDNRKVGFIEPNRNYNSDESMDSENDGVRGPNREEDSDDGSDQDSDGREDMDDEVLRPQMGSKPVIGTITPAPAPESPDNTQSKNKAMAASIKAGLGLSNDTGSSPSSRDNSPRIHQRSRNGNSGSMSFFKNRVGFQGMDSKDNSPSPRPGSPAMASSPKPDVPSIAPVKVDKDYGAFSAKGSGFGLKMLEKMGWKKGYGLGAGGSGIVEPIQTKLRPVKMGIGFKGFKEKTEQDRAEEKRRGLVVSSDEEEQPDKRKRKGTLKKESEFEVKTDGWKKTSVRSSRKGPRVEYKTAAEIQQEIESGDLPMAQIQPQKILDMTGKTVRELTSASQIRTAVAMSHERFPELRHNMELMADISTTDLEQVARTQKSDHIRTQILEKESVRIQQQVEKDELDLERLAKVMTITDQCARIADEIRYSTSDTTGVTAVEMQEDLIATAFQEPFDLFSGLYYDEYEMYQLDQVVVASLQDAFKRLFKDWDVLKNPKRGAVLFRKWQKLFKTSKVSYSQSWSSANVDGDGNGYYGGKPAPQESMTAYESLLHHHWLPKVRSALNNAWDPRDFEPVIALLEAWAPPVLPLFMHDNIVTQLVLPKLHKEIEKWSPRESLMLHTWLHPWLPILGQSRMDQELFGDVRRKLSSALAAWQVLDPSAYTVLKPWRDVFEAADMELLLLKSVLPKLVEGLGAFEVNPRDQKIEILKAVLPWYPFFPSTTFSSLLVNEFFPKWHQVLYLWLTHPSTTDLDQISQWYQWWKSLFPAELLQETGVATGFRQGLDMINQFMAGLKIMAPADVAQAQSQSKGKAGGATNGASLDSFGRLQTKKHLVQSVSFKDLVQDYATQNSLLFVMTKLSHERSGRPLYRLGGNSTGTAGGILVHMTEEVAFVKAEDSGVWMPTVDDYTSGSDSDYTKYWIDWFLGTKGNEYFCEVDEEYILDRFNLTGLNTEVQYYSQALDLITDNLDENLDEEMRDIVEKSARHLYGLIHARFIITTHGLTKMLEKFKKCDFGRCPRVLCHNHPLLPVALSDIPYSKSVKLFCCRCEDIYNPKSSRHASIDGAYFGCSFPHMLFQVYPQLVPPKSTDRYVPRIFGFKLHDVAKQHRYQDMIREESHARIMAGIEGLPTTAAQGSSSGQQNHNNRATDGTGVATESGAMADVN